MLFALLSDEINENSPIDDLFPVLFLFHVKTKLRDVARIIAAAEAAFCINKESPNLAIGRILHEYLHNSPYASSVCLVSMHNVIWTVFLAQATTSRWIMFGPRLSKPECASVMVSYTGLMKYLACRVVVFSKRSHSIDNWRECNLLCALAASAPFALHYGILVNRGKRPFSAFRGTKNPRTEQNLILNSWQRTSCHMTSWIPWRPPHK